MPVDDVLDTPAADRIAQLRGTVAGASVVDAAVAVAAERVGDEGGVVEILTSDITDLRALGGHLSALVDVVGL